MRLRLGMAAATSMVCAAACAGVLAVVSACSSSSASGKSDGGDAAPPCSDTLQNVYAIASCPTDPTGTMPLNYDMAKEHLCSCQSYNTNNGACIAYDAGFIETGNCGDYLVYQFSPSTGGYSKCFYSIKDHSLVGISFTDGMMDQCNNTATTILGGTTEDYCGFGHIDVNVNCAPKPDAGAEGGTD